MRYTIIGLLGMQNKFPHRLQHTSGGRVSISLTNVVRAHGRPPYWKVRYLPGKKRKTFMDTLIGNNLMVDRKYQWQHMEQNLLY